MYFFKNIHYFLILISGIKYSQVFVKKKCKVEIAKYYRLFTSKMFT